MRSKCLMWLWLIPVLLLVAWLGARRLNADVIFVDEYWSIRNSGGAYFGPLSPRELWDNVVLVDPGGMGILYYYGLAGWGALVGWTPAALRASSLLIGLLAVALTYRLGRTLLSQETGLYAAAILGASAFYVDYLHELRAYTLFALFTAWVVWTYWRLIAYKDEPDRRLYVSFLVALIGLIYTHYVALLLAAALGLYHLLFVHKNARWWKITGAAAVAGVAYLPWFNVLLYVFNAGVSQTSRQVTSMTSGQVIETLLYAFSNGSLALLILVALFALGERQRRIIYLWYMILVPLGLVLVVNARVPFMVHLRYLLGLWSLLALIAAFGMVQIGKRGLKPMVVLAVWVGMGLWQSFQPAFINDLFGQIYRAPWAGMAQALDVLRERSHTNDAVLFHMSLPSPDPTQVGSEPFNYFVLDYLMHGIPGHYDQIERMNNSFAQDDNHYLADVFTSLNSAPFVWTLVVPEVPKTQRTIVVNYVLQNAYALCETPLDRPDMRMTLYARRPDEAMAARYSFATDSGAPIQLLPLNTTPTDKTLHLLLGWRVGEAVPANTYSVAVHIENAVGQLVSTGDYALPSAPFGCGASTITLDTLPAGEYRILIGVYPWQTGQRLTGTVNATSETADRLVIDTFTVGS